MKRKAFTIYVDKNPALLMALASHGEYLGYGLCFNPENIAHKCRYIHFYGTSGGWDRDTNCSNHGDITIRDFFKLTPEDVIEKPKLERWMFSQQECKGTDFKQELLTRDQVDRIKAIMDENND